MTHSQEKYSRRAGMAGAGPTSPAIGERDRTLVVQLSPALDEYLRREAARRSIAPDELACRLLMRGLHQQRLDDVTHDLCQSPGATTPTEEALLAARLEAGAMLGAISAWPGASGALNAPPSDAVTGAALEIIERMRGGKAG
jgi:hypothetical protein